MAAMTPPVRKLALTLHVTTSLGWMGAVACFLALALVGLLSQRQATVQAAYVAMATICWFVIMPLSIASPVSGIVQALGTRWGLLRRHWVLGKLLVTVPCTAVLLLHMIPTTELAAAAAHGQLVGDALRDLRIQLVADAVVAMAVLLLATVLAIYKPPGLTARGSRESGGGAAPLPRWALRLRRVAAGVAVLFLAAHLPGKGLGGNRHPSMHVPASSVLSGAAAG